MDLLPIPALIMERYHRVTLSSDIMKVNKIPFLISISHAIKFSTVELLRNQKIPTILVAIKHINSLYRQRGFKIDVMLMDGQFESFRGT